MFRNSTLVFVNLEYCVRLLCRFERRVSIGYELRQFRRRRQDNKRSVHLHAVLAFDKLAVERCVARSVVVYDAELLVLLAAPVVAENLAAHFEGVCTDRYGVTFHTCIDDIVLRRVDSVAQSYTPILVHDVHNDVRAGRQRKSHLLAVDYFLYWYAQSKIVTSNYFLHILFFWLFFFCCGYRLVSGRFCCFIRNRFYSFVAVRYWR